MVSSEDKNMDSNSVFYWFEIRLHELIDECSAGGKWLCYFLISKHNRAVLLTDTSNEIDLPGFSVSNHDIFAMVYIIDKVCK